MGRTKNIVKLSLPKEMGGEAKENPPTEGGGYAAGQDDIKRLQGIVRGVARYPPMNFTAHGEARI